MVIGLDPSFLIGDHQNYRDPIPVLRLLLSFIKPDETRENHLKGRLYSHAARLKVENAIQVLEKAKWLNGVEVDQ